MPTTPSPVRRFLPFVVLTCFFLVTLVWAALKPAPQPVAAQASSPSPSSTPQSSVPPGQAYSCMNKKYFDPAQVDFGSDGAIGNIWLNQVPVNANPQPVTFGSDLNEKFPYARAFKYSLVKGQHVEIFSRETSPSSSFMRIWIFQDSSHELQHASTTRMDFVAPSTGTFYVVIDDWTCNGQGQPSQGMYSMNDVDQIELSAMVERIDGTRTDTLHYANGVYGRMGNQPVKYILRAPEVVSAEPTSSPAGYKLTFKQLDIMTGEFKTYSMHLDVFQRPVPAVTPGSNDWYFWAEETGFDQYKVPNYTVEKWGNEFQIHLTGECCSLISNYFQPNKQYVVLLSSADGSNPSYTWRDQFTTVDAPPTSTGGSCKADLNGDNVVNIVDYSLFVRNIFKPIDQCH